MNFIPRFLPCNTECKQGTSALRSFVRSAPLRYLIFQNSELVELPARGTRRSFALALVGLTRLFGVEPALFAPADAAMGPQSFENHFGCGCGGTRVLAIRSEERRVGKECRSGWVRA